MLHGQKYTGRFYYLLTEIEGHLVDGKGNPFALKNNTFLSIVVDNNIHITESVPSEFLRPSSGGS